VNSKYPLNGEILTVYSMRQSLTDNKPLVYKKQFSLDENSHDFPSTDYKVHKLYKIRVLHW
jgi:hypothetical protein